MNQKLESEEDSCLEKIFLAKNNLDVTKRLNLTTSCFPSSAKYLKSSEICDIIKTCCKAGVATFKFGDFELSFYAKKDQGEALIAYNQSPGPVTAIPSNLLDEADLLRPEEIKLKEDYLSELKITDPYEYENFLASDDKEE